jgi:hypothetical protein
MRSACGVPITTRSVGVSGAPNTLILTSPWPSGSAVDPGVKVPLVSSIVTFLSVPLAAERVMLRMWVLVTVAMVPWPMQRMGKLPGP